MQAQELAGWLKTPDLEMSYPHEKAFMMDHLNSLKREILRSVRVWKGIDGQGLTGSPEHWAVMLLSEAQENVDLDVPARALSIIEDAMLVIRGFFTEDGLTIEVTRQV